jgi:glycosyltransferase involved in cell wall biosynthesis
MNKLVFDIATTGHHSEYIDHLIEYLCANISDVHYIFVVHPNFKEKFPNIVSKSVNSLNINWVYVTQQELDLCYKGNLIQKSFNQYKVLNKYALENKVTHAVILYFNTLQFALILKRPNYTVSGILFLQFYRMQVNTFNEKLKYYRKYYTTYLYSINKKITRVHILNDQKSVDFLNSKFKTKIFKKLPDPIPQLKPLAGFDIYQHYGLNKDQKIFLHIGGLADRKGTFEVVKSSEFIPKEIQSKIVILLVGKTNNNQVEKALKNQLKASSKSSEVTIIWDNQFIPTNMMKSLFNQCKTVLIPYKNVEASSGILGHAMASNKRVITTGKGLLKELVVENNLGYLLNEVTPSAIAKKMKESYNINIESLKVDRLLQECDPNIFSLLILK